MNSIEHSIGGVRRFWFADPPGARRKAWFVKDPEFDAEIRTRFLSLYEQAAAGRLGAWRDTPDGALALIVLTDQFPRNMFRGQARAFETDPLALAVARQVTDQNWDATMRPVERMFVYLPYEHSEVLADQERSIQLFAPMAAFKETEDTADYARRHWEIVRRFGRFPHRNSALERASTEAEAAFLLQPGSGF